MNFETNIIFRIKPFFLFDQTIKSKSWISWEWIIPIQDEEGGREGQKGPPTSFSPITFASVRVGSQNFLTFILIFLTDWCKISRLYLVAVPIY